MKIYSHNFDFIEFRARKLKFYLKIVIYYVIIYSKIKFIIIFNFKNNITIFGFILKHKLYICNFFNTN